MLALVFRGWVDHLDLRWTIKNQTLVCVPVELNCDASRAQIIACT